MAAGDSFVTGTPSWDRPSFRERDFSEAGRAAFGTPVVPSRHTPVDLGEHRLLHLSGLCGLYPLFGNQADRWSAMPGLDAAQRVAVAEYAAAIGELARLNAKVLSAAARLKPVTIEALLAKSGCR